MQTQEQTDYFYGVSLNGSLYLFGPFKHLEDAQVFLEEKRFTRVTESDYIFSPNYEYEAQFAKIQLIPCLVKPNTIKEKMRKKGKR